MERSVNFGERLADERRRQGLNQTDFAALGGVTVKTQVLYEKSERVPDANYLAAVAQHGVDVLYVLTGQHVPSLLSAEEGVVLAGYRELDARGRAGVLALIGGLSAGTSDVRPAKATKRSQVIVGGSGNVQVGTVGKSIKKKAKH
ncbi:helix-turn-helix domain-containing protein [Ralstonia sp. CHL-2022]|uniref:Helix-turn-helix domain-containing protein n=1 Tax=Ralstonia mojiangensis TaxID=2953895 RepID=A0AAE3I412_9RALS|nr:helix-turn-helix domain-containing protein [Ralstonia mojiangensis]MCT7316767.1 helix-turn-helix domain-containing protein [Ralstonia mojiangensis]